MIRPRPRNPVFYGDGGEAWVMQLTGRRTDLSSVKGFVWVRCPEKDCKGIGATGPTGLSIETPTGPTGTSQEAKT